MIFTRSDSLDNQGNNQVTYSLVDAPGYTFAVTATRAGVQISGTTPVYTDKRSMNQIFIWAYAQYDSLRTQGVAIPQNKIVGWQIWPVGP